MEEEVFKVVSSDRKGLASAMERHYKVIYKPNEWIKAKIGKIFAFTMIEDANHFRAGLGDNYHYELWKGIGKNTEEIYLIGLNWEDTEQFWEGILTSTFHAPPGTVVVDKIKLLEKVA